MKIVIIGEGKVGFLLAQRLTGEGHDVTVVDNNPVVLSESVEELDIQTVQGNGADLDILREANVGAADLLIVTTSADETNLLCCLAGKKLGCGGTIARVRNPDYVRQSQFLREELGLSLSVNPELAAAQEIYRLLQFPSFLKRESFDKGRVELVEMQIAPDSALAGRSIADAPTLLGVRALICAVERGGDVTIPNGRFVLRGGDRITVTAARTDLALLMKRLGLVRQKIRSVMVIGCSRIAGYLTEELIRSSVSVKLIDRNRERCEAFALRFPTATVVCGDVSHRGLLESEGISRTDAVISLTGVDEENLIVSLFAQRHGVQKTVTKVDRNEYAGLFSDQGVGSVVCPKELTANEIIRYVRALANGGGAGAVKALHRIVEGKAEALEFTVGASAFTGRPLAKLRIKPDILIACISRNNQVIIPKGDDTIERGDTVVVVTAADHTIGEFGDVFERDAARE